MLYQAQNGIYPAAIFINQFFQTADRGQEWAGAGGGHNDIRLELTDSIFCPFRTGQYVKVFQLGSPVCQISGEIRQPPFGGQLRDF